MTDPETVPEAAVEAAAEALYVSFLETTKVMSRPSWSTLFEWAREDWRTDTRAALTAALPHLEAHLREHIAAEIEAQGRAVVEWLAAHRVDDKDMGRLIGTEDAYKDSIRIARGEKFSLDDMAGVQ